MLLILQYSQLPYHAIFANFPLPRIAVELFSCELSTSLLSCMTLPPFKGQQSVVVVGITTISVSNSDPIAASV